MDTERMISELKSLEVKHRNDKVFTGQLNISEMAHDVRKRLEELKPCEDTGLTPEQIRELKESVQRLDKIFGDEITVDQVIDFFVDFYIAQRDPDRVEAAELLTNEEVARYRELKERDTAMEINEIHVDEYYCPVCGAENNCDQGVVEDNFCPRCGQRLKVRED